MDDKLEELLAEIARQLQDPYVRAELRAAMRPALAAVLEADDERAPDQPRRGRHPLH